MAERQAGARAGAGGSARRGRANGSRANDAGGARRQARRRRGRPPLSGSLRPGAPQPVGLGGAHAPAARGAAHDQRPPRGAGVPRECARARSGAGTCGPWSATGTRAGFPRGTMKNLMVHLRWWAGDGRQGVRRDAGQRPLRHRGPQGRAGLPGWTGSGPGEGSRPCATSGCGSRWSSRPRSGSGARRRSSSGSPSRIAATTSCCRPSWCKGGRARSVPIFEGRPTRELLDRMHAFAGKDALIRPGGEVRAADGAVPARHPSRRDPEVAPAAARIRPAPLPGARPGFPCAAAGGKGVRGMAREERRHGRPRPSERSLASAVTGRVDHGLAVYVG